ncbi:MAG: TonB-dependent receptor [Lacunisphaera sp.]|nr:TonB-dependent receptor [Lacunisphaera sp.]MDB6165668.1 TonB-dependent receptor [Lacunisphaera sp.]
MQPKNSIPRFTRWATLVATIVFCTALARAQQSDAAPAAPDKNPDGTDKVVTLEAFTVTGIRRGIEESIATKRESVSVVESVSSEDIGKLPDISIAESIARLPGLAAQRVAGRASVISVRGLAPDFATTLLNGREQVSTGDNRGVEFDQYPSELIRTVVVYKTPDASLVGQGLSGTLDMQTIRPLSFSHRLIALNARYQTNSVSMGAGSKSSGNRYSLTYIDQNADKTVGFSFGYAHLDDPIIARATGSYGYGGGGSIDPNGLKTFDFWGSNKRDGFTASLEFRPNSNFTTSFDAYYSKFARKETDTGIETNTGYNGGQALSPTYTSITKDAQGNITGGVLTNVVPLARNIYNQRDDKLTAFGWNARYNAGKWIFVADISYSEAKRQELNLETNGEYLDAANNPVLDTVTYNFATGGFPTFKYNLNYADAAHIKVGPSIYGGGYGKSPSIDDKLTSYKIDLSRSLDKGFDNVDFGFNYGDREKFKHQPEAGLNTLGGNWTALDSSVSYSPATLGFAGAPSSAAWNVPAALAKYYQAYAPVDNVNYLIPKTWTVVEKISTAYAQLNLNSQFSWGRLRGNLGVQAKNVDQSSHSNIWDDNVNGPKPVTDGKKYTDFLPSLNLAFEFEGDQVLRFAAAKQVARPRLDQMKISSEIGVDQTTGKPGGSGGNPRLDPWRADALDISYEKYFAKKGYFSIAGFYKKLTSYIYDQNNPNFDFTKYIVGNPFARTNTGSFSQPLNGQGGNLSGAEFSLSVPLSLFTSSLEGFGVVASYTANHSSIMIHDNSLGSGAAIALPGLSKSVANITVYYEKSGFSARLSERIRADFIGEINGFGADRSLTYIKGENVLDAQLGYDFKTGALKGLGLVVQCYNLNDAPYEEYVSTKDRINQYQKYGRTILFGANYKF